MRYQYNFSFLENWAAANPKLAKGPLQNALGVKSNNGIKSWIRKEGPMPVISMLRFCNTFNVPLSAFFRDADAEEYTTVIPLPNINDQLEPDGGYADSPNNRQQGERSFLNPTHVKVIDSIVPNLEYLTHKNSNTQAEPTDSTPTPTPAPNPVPSLTKNNENYLQAIIELENLHAQQRKRYLDIIADMQKQIADLTNKIIVLEQDMPKYKVIQEYAPDDYNEQVMNVAEPDNK